MQLSNVAFYLMLCSRKQSFGCNSLSVPKQNITGSSKVILKLNQTIVNEIIVPSFGWTNISARGIGGVYTSEKLGTRFPMLPPISTKNYFMPKSPNRSMKKRNVRSSHLATRTDKMMPNYNGNIYNTKKRYEFDQRPTLSCQPLPKPSKPKKFLSSCSSYNSQLPFLCDPDNLVPQTVSKKILTHARQYNISHCFCQLHQLLKHRLAFGQTKQLVSYSQKVNQYNNLDKKTHQKSIAKGNNIKRSEFANDMCHSCSMAGYERRTIGIAVVEQLHPFSSDIPFQHNNLYCIKLNPTSLSGGGAGISHDDMMQKQAAKLRTLWNTDRHTERDIICETDIFILGTNNWKRLAPRQQHKPNITLSLPKFSNQLAMSFSSRIREKEKLRLLKRLAEINNKDAPLSRKLLDLVRLLKPQPGSLTIPHLKSGNYHSKHIKAGPKRLPKYEGAPGTIIGMPYWALSVMIVCIVITCLLIVVGHIVNSTHGSSSLRTHGHHPKAAKKKWQAGFAGGLWDTGGGVTNV